MQGKLEGEGEIDVDLDGKSAITRYRAVEHVRSLKHEWISKVELWPHTGRKHQLRRHLQHKGHPILGDPIYGDTGSKSMRLWAMEVSVPHPVAQVRTRAPHNMQWISYAVGV